MDIATTINTVCVCVCVCVCACACVGAHVDLHYQSKVLETVV